MTVKICPSILNSDVLNLAAELDKIATADWIHVDVMDNHFVPNLSWGLPIAEACVQGSDLPVDAHLMIENPDRWALDYADAGCKSVTFHAEAAVAPIRLARELRARGCRAGIAFRPSTPVEGYLDFLAEFDLLLVMTVEPGFGGQPLLPKTLSKVSQLREAVDQSGLVIDIQVDGGISRATIGEAARAGANSFVAGSAIYRSVDPTVEVKALRDLAVMNR